MTQNELNVFYTNLATELADISTELKRLVESGPVYSSDYYRSRIARLNEMFAKDLNQ